jgi:hypothetical protein
VHAQKVWEILSLAKIICSIKERIQRKTNNYIIIQLLSEFLIGVKSAKTDPNIFVTQKSGTVCAASSSTVVPSYYI